VTGPSSSRRSVVAIRHVAFEDLGLLSAILDRAGWAVSYCDAPTADLAGGDDASHYHGDGKARDQCQIRARRAICDLPQILDGRVYASATATNKQRPFVERTYMQMTIVSQTRRPVHMETYRFLVSLR
jgi:hypothetical protein